MYFKHFTTSTFLVNLFLVLGERHFFQFAPLRPAPPFKSLRHRTTVAFLQLNYLAPPRHM